MHNGKIKPIFILGSARCGTTSLSNILSSHPAIAALCTEEHWGICEAQFLMWGHYFGDISIEDNFFYFMNNFIQSDLFRLSGLSADFLWKKRPSNIIDLYRFFMDEYAESRGCDFWLNNAPRQTFFAETLQAEFPDAYFVAIRRDISEAVWSNVKYSGGTKKILRIAQKVFRYYSDYKALDRFKKKKPPLIEISFEDLVYHRKNRFSQVLNFLGVNESVILKNRYKKNTSFSPHNEKNTTFKTSDILLVQLFLFIFRIIPWPLISFFRARWDISKAKAFKTPPFFYRLHPKSKKFRGFKFQKKTMIN